MCFRCHLCLAARRVRAGDSLEMLAIRVWVRNICAIEYERGAMWFSFHIFLRYASGQAALFDWVRCAIYVMLAKRPWIQDEAGGCDVLDKCCQGLAACMHGIRYGYARAGGVF